MGLVKLGQPHPDSYLSDEANSGSPDTMYARFLVIQIFAGSGMLGAALLGHAILFGPK